jgi:hypothetical protein
MASLPSRERATFHRREQARTEFERPVKQRGYDWSDQMTLCIAATGRAPVLGSINPNRMVMCFDSKVGNEAFGSETENKFHIPSDRVMAMAADRPGRAKELASIYESHLKSNPLTDANLLDVLSEPIKILKRKIASAYLARKLGISYQDFLDHGLAWFGQTACDKYRGDIENNPLGMEMIIGGFIDREPFICELRSGEIERVTNFSVIGTGAYTAEPALHAREQMPNTDLPRTVYNVFEAKKLGEASPYVGHQTRLFILGPSHPKSDKLEVEVLTSQGQAALEKRFEKFGPKKVKPHEPLPDGAFMTGSY